MPKGDNRPYVPVALNLPHAGRVARRIVPQLPTPAEAGGRDAEAARQCILSFGEILWDVINGNEVIGGAPFNVAAHATRCGLRACIYSRVGADERGDRARSALRRFNVADRWVQTDLVRPTGWVDIVLDQHGQPHYHIARDVAWDAIEPPNPAEVRVLETTRFAALVCGTLAQRTALSRTALATVRERMWNVPVLYDVNLRAEETPIEVVRATLPGVTIVKLNEEEADVIGLGLWGRRCEPAELFRRLKAEYGVKMVVCTKGRNGCSIFSDGGIVSVASAPVTVVSAVGAGDAFAAAFLAGFLRGLPLKQAAMNANLLGGYVASKRETVPEYSPDLLARLQGLQQHAQD